jgi:hypothetical protein
VDVQSPGNELPDDEIPAKRLNKIVPDILAPKQFPSIRLVLLGQKIKA